MTKLLALALLTMFVACNQSNVKKYRDLLEPRVGSAKKDEINQLLGAPAWCRDEEGSQRCEYRTSRATNNPVPDMYRKEASLGPDLSPYDHFDVLHLHF